MARGNPRNAKYCTKNIKLLLFIVSISILVIILMDWDLEIYSNTFTFFDKQTNIDRFANCGNLLDILRVQWNNNTNCSWNFISSDCAAIQKYNYLETQLLLEVFQRHNLLLTLFGDSVTRRSGKTLDLYINHRGKVEPLRDKTYKKMYSYFIVRSQEYVHWQTEWAPFADDVINILMKKTYPLYFYNNNSINIAVLGIGVWMYAEKKFPRNYTMEQIVTRLPGMIHNYVKWIYDNYFDRNSLNAMENGNKFHIILRTQTGLDASRSTWRTREDFSNLTKLYNKYLIKYANMYGIPIFDTYHWSSFDPTYHINLDGDVVENTEMYDQLDHINCSFCKRKPPQYRHQCIECEDNNCIHMRSNGRMILIQQILNAINIIAHKQGLLT